MKRKFIILFNLFAVFLIAGNLMAQINARPGETTLEQRLNTVAQDKLEVQVTPESVDDYCIPSADCSWGDGFEDFIFAGIENLATGCSAGGYGDYTTLPAGSAEIGYSYTAGFVTGYSDQMVSMWVDFNDDEVFSEMERILTDFNLPAASSLFETDINIPGNAVPGIHRMRIGANWIDPSSPDPCAALTYGEWEDYMLEITGDPISLNAAVLSIDMASIALAGDVIPTVTIANMGVETISFPVTFDVPSVGYSSTIDVVDLAMGGVLQLEFDVWTVDVGAYDVEVCTYLSGDEIPDDDCEAMTIAFSDQPRQKVVAEFFTGTW